MKHTPDTETAELRLVATALRKQASPSTEKFQKELKTRVLAEFRENNRSVSVETIPSFYVRLRNRILLEFRRIFARQISVREKMLVKLLQNKNVQMPLDFSRSLRQEVLSEFRKIQEKKSILGIRRAHSFEKLLARGTSFWRVFRWGTFPVFAVVMVLLLFPRTTPQNAQVALERLPSLTVPESLTMPSALLSPELEEEEEDLVYFALLDDFGKTLNSLEELERSSLPNIEGI